MVLVKSREWIYAARVAGRFQRIHRVSGAALLALLFAGPWIRIGGQPALQIDLPGRRLYALGATFSANETFYLVLLGLMAAFSLFFVTALYGRVWCGYLCPQTVFLEEWIRRIEAAIEGDAPRRRKRDEGPWTFDRAWRKAAKWTAFAAISFVTAMTLVSYFSGARPLWTGAAGSVSYAFVGVMGGLAFLDFAWFREQLCNYVCPYARFQGALTDDESLVVAYQPSLGEPRKGTKGIDKSALGACVDCRKCVVVCPQGIDIRNGYQLECINCARCIDACEIVMTKLEKPNLVRYTTIAATEGRKARRLRPRTVAYGSLLGLLATAFVLSLHERHETQAFFDRAPGTLFQIDADGHVRNTYLLKVTNNRAEGDDVAYTFTVDGLPNAEVIVPPISVAPRTSATIPVVIRVPAHSTKSMTVPLTVHLRTHDDDVRIEGTFKSPES
jgi:cytochrome c oxidase accessory protein FixG